MAVDYKDYYNILGINEHVDQKEVRQAYRKLARQYHPDVNPSDQASEEKFKEINEANEVLSDPEKRKKYDEMRTYYQHYGQWPGASASAGSENFDGFSGGNYKYRTMREEDLEDLFGGTSPFSDFFNTYFSSDFFEHSNVLRTPGRRQSSMPIPGEDVESTVDVTLAEAYQGVTRALELTELDGNTRLLEVKVPAGVNDGARIRIAGLGMQGSAGRGDLYLYVHVTADPRFSREGLTLRTAVNVPLAVAVLGGEVYVPTPDGRRLLLRIPAGTNSGQALRLRGQGMPQVNHPDSCGDLYAEVKIALPKNLTAEQRRLFEEFARSTGYKS